MSESNVTIVRAIYEAFGRGDLNAVLSRFDDHIAWLTPATLPWSKGDYHGPAEVAGYFASFMANLDAPVIAPSEFIDAGSRIVVQGVERAEAKSTGRAFEARFTHTWTLKDGKVTEMRGVVDTAAIRDSFSDAR